jgi:hypothetical protein
VDGNCDGRLTEPGRLAEDGSCEALLPSDGRVPVDGRVAGEAGTRPALGREAPLDGNCEGREMLPPDGRETAPVDGREMLPEDGRE